MENSKKWLLGIILLALFGILNCGGNDRSKISSWPEKVGELNLLADYAVSMIIENNRAYVASSDGLVTIVDISNPRNPVSLNSKKLFFNNGIRKMVKIKEYLYIIPVNGRYIKVVNADTLNEELDYHFNFPANQAGNMNDLTAISNMLCVAGSYISFLDVSSPLNIVEVSRIDREDVAGDEFQNIYSIAESQGRILAIDGITGAVLLFDASPKYLGFSKTSIGSYFVDFKALLISGDLLLAYYNTSFHSITGTVRGMVLNVNSVAADFYLENEPGNASIRSVAEINGRLFINYVYYNQSMEMTRSVLRQIDVGNLAAPVILGERPFEVCSAMNADSLYLYTVESGTFKVYRIN